MKKSLKQKIIDKKIPFIFFHTHIASKETIEESIENHKSIDLDISIDKNKKPYLGHSEEYYNLNNFKKPITMDFYKAIDMISKSEIPVMIDCKDNNAWKFVEETINKIGESRCLVHSFISELKFNYDLSYDLDYSSEWSSASKLKLLKKRFPNLTTTASCKFLPNDLLLKDEFLNLLKKIRTVLMKNNIDTICLNVPDDTMNDKILEFFLSYNIIPHINIDNTNIDFNNIYIGETNILLKSSDFRKLK